MWRRLTSAWTDTHLALISTSSCLVLLGVLAAVAGDGSAQVVWSTVGISIFVFAAATFMDAFGGLVLGLIAAAALTTIHQYLPDARPVPFAIQATTFALFLLLGISSGTVVDRIRRGRRIAERESSRPTATVAGSIGMMTAADAELVLEQEKVRARLYGRPLCVAAVEISLSDDGVGPEERRRLRRAVARSLETELRVTDVVYCDESGRFGAILPETTEQRARDVLESVLMVARQATFADRDRGGRRQVCEVADLTFAVTAVSSVATVTSITQTKTTATRRPTRVTAAPSESAEAV